MFLSVRILCKQTAPERMLEGKMTLSRSIMYALFVAAFAASPLGGQSPSPRDGQTHTLPPTTGEALTIVPIDREDITCSVEEWHSGLPQPFLKLICPPKTEFAPLRVYLKLSWMTPANVPPNLEKITSPAGGLTKIRTNREAVSVLLQVTGEPDRAPKKSWVRFNGVADLALIKDRP